MNWLLRWLLGRYAHDLGEAILRNLDRDQCDKFAEIPVVPEGKPTIEEFQFVSYDESGRMIGPSGTHRLVCVTVTGANVVIFGRGSELTNINTVLRAGGPCVVRSETHPASRPANLLFGHTHWVWEHSKLEVASPRLVEEVLAP